MKDSPTARTSAKDMRSSCSLLFCGLTTDLLWTTSKLKFHQHDAIFKFKILIFQILLQILFYPEVFKNISVSNLNGRPSHSTAAKTDGLLTQIMRTPNRDGSSSSPFQHWSFAAGSSWT